MTTRQIYLKQSDYSTGCVHLVPDFSIVAPHCVELGPQKWVHFHHFARGKGTCLSQLGSQFSNDSGAAGRCQRGLSPWSMKGGRQGARGRLGSSKIFDFGKPIVWGWPGRQILIQSFHRHILTYLDIFRHSETSKHWLVREKLTSGRFRSRQGVPRLVGGPSHCWVVNVEEWEPQLSARFESIWVQGHAILQDDPWPTLPTSTVSFVIIPRWCIIHFWSLTINQRRCGTAVEKCDGILEGFEVMISWKAFFSQWFQWCQDEGMRTQKPRKLSTKHQESVG